MVESPFAGDTKAAQSTSTIVVLVVDPLVGAAIAFGSVCIVGPAVLASEAELQPLAL
jgi:hypothetical protein